MNWKGCLRRRSRVCRPEESIANCFRWTWLSWRQFHCLCVTHISHILPGGSGTTVRHKKETNCVASVREWTVPTERTPPGKLVSTFADRGYRVVSAKDLYGHILGFIDLSRYFFFQVAAHMHPRGWVDSVPDQCGSAGNLTLDLWICSLELWPLDQRGRYTYLPLNGMRLVWNPLSHFLCFFFFACREFKQHCRRHSSI
jgi:hypothetical protein